mmetsp:Transcript_128882/g.401009  ORF Transcript_128882/g.401009 Transcript_128882/m.401009 type:complete len:210 (-) Transcript_128882:80-709(-)
MVLPVSLVLLGAAAALPPDFPLPLAFAFFGALPPAAPTIPMMASGAYLLTTSGGWIMSNSAVASLPAKVRMASSPPGCWERKLVTLRTLSCRITQQSPFVVCLATSSLEYPAMPGGKAAVSSSSSSLSSSSSPPPPPSSPMTASGAYFETTSGGWIMSNSAVASLPAKVRIASSPPGCWERKLETFSTRSCRMTQQSPLVVCLATSSLV